MGAQKVKGKFIAANFGQGGADLKFADVVIANVDLKALRATPKTLVAAPGNGKVLEFLSAVLVLAAGSNVLVEATANLAVKYQNGAGVQRSAIGLLASKTGISITVLVSPFLLNVRPTVYTEFVYT